MNQRTLRFVQMAVVTAMLSAVLPNSGASQDLTNCTDCREWYDGWSFQHDFPPWGEKQVNPMTGEGPHVGFRSGLCFGMHAACSWDTNDFLALAADMRAMHNARGLNGLVRALGDRVRVDLVRGSIQRLDCSQNVLANLQIDRKLLQRVTNGDRHSAPL